MQHFHVLTWFVRDTRPVFSNTHCAKYGDHEPQTTLHIRPHRGSHERRMTHSRWLRNLAQAQAQ